MSTTRTALVIGGGIAGPVTATALHKAGIEARVYEAYPGSTFGVGSGLALAPNGVAALDIVGVGDRIRELASPITNMEMSVGGKHLRMPTLPNTLLHLVDRNELHQALHDRAVAAGVPFEYDKRLVSVDEHESGVTAHFADGTSATADVLVGADGIRSTVRGLIDPKAPGPNYTGMLGFGAIIDSDIDIELGTMTFAFGKQAYYLYGAVERGRIMWGANLPHREYMSLSEARAVPVEHWLKVLRATYADDTPGGEFARNTTAETLETTGALHIMPPVPHWYRGRMVLVGDSVHAPSNSSGQGGSLAIESAVQLARCLRDLPDPAAAFAAYERSRRSRVESITARAAKINHSKTPGPVARKVMPVIMRLMVRFMDMEKTMGAEQRYRIDWDTPVQKELTASAA
jgi:2-polyprenyl-6-methoxyphenol hydroxylase-like FAD-dependent oxidoreductase